MSANRNLAACLALGIALAAATSAAAVEISQLPMSAKSQATPNVIFGIDDSGSMDWELMMPTPSGILYWSGYDRFHYERSSRQGGGHAYETNGVQYGYLFPNGFNADARNYSDSSFAAVPPTPQFAFARSHHYNPMYYNPGITYVPWAPAYIDGATRRFADADPTRARSHPWFPTSGTPVTIDLTSTLSVATSGWTFRVQKNTELNGQDNPGIRVGSTDVTSNTKWSGSDNANGRIPYFPATYWAKEDRASRPACSADDPCAQGPDGAQLRRIEIRPGIFPNDVFPSGRSYQQEIQNFANWFQYYRKRKLLLASAMSSALSNIKGIRGGTTYFDADRRTSGVTMHDFFSEDDAKNGRAVLGAIYANPADSGTPTRGALNYIGRQFMRTDSSAPIQFSCQRNAAFVLTDGYANDYGVTLSPSRPSYASGAWHGSPPYSTTATDTLADIAAAYYTTNLRPDLPTGMLSIDPSDTNPNADMNTDLHMQTYGITLGAVGTIYGTDKVEASNPFLNYPSWPTAKRDDPTSIDDLWHATINGRGDMYAAYNAEQVSAAMQEVVRKILVAAGSDAGIAVSTVNLRDGNNTAFVSSYNARNWTGNIAAYPIDTATGTVDTASGREFWSARELLDARDPATRLIVSHNGSYGVPFTPGGLGATLVGQLALNGDDGADVVNWLRGDRSKEGSVYRVREHVLGDIVSSEPVYLDGVVYQAANDGMLHAFDADNGTELWAYVPYNVLSRLATLADPLYEHRFFVDGTPTVAKIENKTKTILVGGLRGGGTGYYALDVTDPRPASEAALASRVLWEFPNSSTPVSVRDQLGMSFGKPVVVKTAANGWVVLLTSGYNNSSGSGHLFVLDASSGALLKTISTSAGSGLAHVSAWIDDPAADEPVSEFAYGGDLEGNVWRFDLRVEVDSWSVSLLSALGPNAPVTSAPELAYVEGQRLVLFGTGQLLGEPDVITDDVHSVYGIADRDRTITDPAARLFRQTLTEAAGGIRHVTNSALDWNSYDGWRFDLPSGERVSTDPSVAFGALMFTSNKPSAIACSTESFLYSVDVANGGQMPPGAHQAQAWTGRRLGFAYSSRPVTVTLPGGEVVAITHKSDTTVASSMLPVGGPGKLQRLGWREVFR